MITKSTIGRIKRFDDGNNRLKLQSSWILITSEVRSVLSISEISPLMRESMRTVRTGRSGRVYLECSPIHSTAETTRKHQHHYHDIIITIIIIIISSSSSKSSLVPKSGFGLEELISLCSSYHVHLFLINLLRPVNKSTKMSHKHLLMLSAKTVNHLHLPCSKNPITSG